MARGSAARMTPDRPRARRRRRQAAVASPHLDPKESCMPRLVAASGLFSAVAIIAGLIVSVAAGRAELTLASSASEVAAALEAPAATGVWVGLGLETLGLLAVVVFGAAVAS